jgi:hypothetical protein
MVDLEQIVLDRDATRDNYQAFVPELGITARGSTWEKALRRVLHKAEEHELARVKAPSSGEFTLRLPRWMYRRLRAISVAQHGERGMAPTCRVLLAHALGLQDRWDAEGGTTAAKAAKRSKTPQRERHRSGTTRRRKTTSR